MRMHRDTLKAMLRKRPLVQAVRANVEIEATRKRLAEALQTLRDVGISEQSISEVKAKYDECVKIRTGYGILLDETFGVPWQLAAIVAKHIDLADCDDWQIDKLPEHVE